MGTKRRRDEAITGAVVYLRVSTGKQAESGLGMEAQEAKCREHCERNGWPVVAVHRDDGVSGREDVSSRPGLAAALEAVRAAPGRVLVAYSLSRVSRRLSVVLRILVEEDTPFASATEALETATPQGKFIVRVFASLAELESDLTAERTRDALEAARARGVKLGAPSLLESTRIIGHHPKSGRPIRERYVNPEKLARVKAIQALGAETALGPTALAQEANRRGLKAVRGGKWHPRTVRLAMVAEIPG